MSDLRPYQSEAMDAIRASVKQGVRRLVLQAPTGSGKTRVAAEIILGAQRKNSRTIFLVDAISLVDQTLEMFAREGVENIGVIQADHKETDWSRPVQIASIQTIRARGKYPEAQVVIVDEVHRLHKEHVKWMGHIDKKSHLPVDCPGWENVPFIGLSATPWTRGLGRFFQSLQIMSATKELIQAGYLSPFVVYASDSPDLSDVKITAGDYNEAQLTKVMQGSALVANIVKTWQDKWNKDKTLLFCVDCAHAKMLQARFQDAGISCAYQDANSTMKERADIKRGFHDGTYKIISNVGTLTTGVDFDVRCLILARPTKSEMLYVQIIGRALRTAAGKDKALILDHTDTTGRLGFASDIEHETLSGGRFGEKDRAIRKPPLPKPCPSCACLIPVGAKKCPGCGFERKVVSQTFEREGTLVEFTGTFRKKHATSNKQYPYTPTEKARFYAQLKGHGQTKGYKPGWAKIKYTEKFGDWPDRAWEHITPMAPGPEVANWIKHLNIQWAKSKHSSKPEDRSDGTFRF